MLTRFLAAGNSAPYEPPYWDISRISPIFANSGYVGDRDSLPLDIKFKTDGTIMFLLGDSGNDITSYTLSVPWDVTSITYSRVFDASAYVGTIPSGLCISDDGTDIYIIANNLGRIVQFTSITPWVFDSGTTSYTGFLEFDTIVDFPNYMEGLYFKAGGFKAYAVGYNVIGSDCYLTEITLSTAWDITSYSSFVAQSITTPTGLRPRGLAMSSSGDTVFINDDVTADVYQYALSTPWDVTTLSYVQDFTGTISGTSIRGLTARPEGTAFFYVEQVADNVYAYGMGNPWSIAREDRFSVSVQDSAPVDIAFKPDGAKMYMLGNTGNDINEYNLSIDWDITTAVYNTKSSALIQTFPSSLYFKSNGLSVYIAGSSPDEISRYDLGTAWDISTATYVQSLDPIGKEPLPSDVFFKPDGTKMYTVGVSDDYVNEYSLHIAWDVSTSFYIQSFSVAAQETSPTGVFFKSDGTKMYIIGGTGDDVNEYDLSTAWDVSTATYVRAKSIFAQETAPTSVFFKDDGTKMYVIGTTGDDVNEYSLGTAWNVSTATYVRVKSVSAQETSPQGLFFKPDGSKMYVLGAAGDDVNEYSLGTAWDVSTATYVQNFSVSTQETSPTGVFFKYDGTKMYIIGSAVDAVFEYNLGTAWDVSTATYSKNFQFYNSDETPLGVTFKSDGTKMYVAYSNDDTIREYTLLTAWDISAAYVSASLNVNIYNDGPRVVKFYNDGLILFIASVGHITKYNLSTAWDITSAVFEVQVPVASPSTAFGFDFDDVGSALYTIDGSSDAIKRWNLF